MNILEQTHTRLSIRFGDAILPAIIMVVGLIIGLAFAIYGSASDLIVFVIVGALFAFGGFLRFAMERHITLTFDRMAGTLNIRVRRYLVPNSTDYSLRDIRRVDAVTQDGTPVNQTPPGANVRFTLVIDFIDLPDYGVAHNIKRDEAAEVVVLIDHFLGS